MGDATERITSVAFAVSCPAEPATLLTQGRISLLAITLTNDDVIFGCMNRGRLDLYRRCSPVVDTEYGDGELQSPVVEIAEALSEATDTEMGDLPPLHDYVDTDALDRLFDTSEKGVETMTLSFKIDQWNVFVSSDGNIRVCDATALVDPEPVFENEPA